MSTEVTTEEPVLELDGKKYVISELSDQEKYFVQALGHIKSKLNQIYRDDPEQLGVIERAWHASGKQNILPIPMTNEETTEEIIEE